MVEHYVQEKSKTKNEDLLSMPFEELVFFADVKCKVVKTHRHTLTAPKIMVFSTALFIIEIRNSFQ